VENHSHPHLGADGSQNWHDADESQAVEGAARNHAIPPPGAPETDQRSLGKLCTSPISHPEPTSYPFAVIGDEFKGKRVLVTGGTKGMGEAMVRRLQLSGASVATTARSPLPPDQAPDCFVQADLGTAPACKRRSIASCGSGAESAFWSIMWAAQMLPQSDSTLAYAASGRSRWPVRLFVIGWWRIRV
jgi:hypothetical protein